MIQITLLSLFLLTGCASGGDPIPLVTRDIIHPDMSQVSTSASGCRVTESSRTVRGTSMEPMIHDGSEIVTLDDYYRCGGVVSRGDVVVLEDSATRGPYLKRVRALPGDRVSISSTGTMMIEGVLLTNSRGQVYVFAPREQTMLSLYIRQGRLQEGAYYVFGDNIVNSIDSRRIGGVNIASFQAKVVRP